MPSDPPPVPFPPFLHTLLEKARLKGHVPDEKRIRFTVVLKPGDLPEDHPVARKLQQVLQHAPHRRRHLDHAELRQLMAPKDGHIAAVEAFARRFGLDVVSASKLRHEVVLEGPVGAINKAFRIKLCRFEHDTGECRAHQEPIHLPPPLHDIVQAIIGLDDIPLLGRSATPAGGRPTYAVPDVAKHYAFPNPATGAGQRIAILSFGGGFHDSDIDQYFRATLDRPAPKIQEFQIESRGNDPLDLELLRKAVGDFNDESVTYDDMVGKYGQETVDNALHTIEITMDIQIAGAVAPGAEIDVYHAPGTASGIRESILSAMGLGEVGRQATVISMSWGSAESGWRADYMNAIHAAITNGKHLGVTFCAASGDYGSADPPGSEVAGVEFPASSPDALGVGGTQFTGPEHDPFSEESVLNSPWQGYRMGSGGGVSGFFAIPDFQKRCGVPEADGSKTWISGEASGFKGRGVPDVAANSMEFKVVCAGEWTAGEGTSAAAPLWAGLVALLSEDLGQALGYLNDAFYAEPASASFNSITKGNNDILGGSVPSYEAREGWDPCTGWGSPDASRLIAALQET